MPSVSRSCNACGLLVHSLFHHREGHKHRQILSKDPSVDINSEVYHTQWNEVFRLTPNPSSYRNDSNGQLRRPFSWSRRYHSTKSNKSTGWTRWSGWISWTRWPRRKQYLSNAWRRWNRMLSLISFYWEFSNFSFNLATSTRRRSV